MEKRKRTAALSTFTRNVKSLTQMLDSGSPKIVVDTQFEKLQVCWNKLEEAHDEFIKNSEVDLDEDSADMKYLDEPSERHLGMVKRYSENFKTSVVVERDEVQQKDAEARAAEEKFRREAEEKVRKDEVKARFDSAKAELQMSVASFKRLAVSLKDSVINASDSDKRRELEKLEAEFTSVKQQLIKFAGIDHSQDISEINETFVSDAEKHYIDFRTFMVGELKDSSSTSGGAIFRTDQTTRKEAVKLPTFQGEEQASPFLNFPIWLKRWDVMILEYPEQYRVNLLWEHIDDAAQQKCIGFENDYKEAMKRLTQFYGDPSKVVHCVMREVNSPSPICEGDYEGLISYSDIIVNNFNRLKSIKLEHEMSNTSSMAMVVKKLPRLVGEKWYEYLLQKSSTEKAVPFPIFIDWLSSQREIWECMVTSSASESGQSFFVEEHLENGVKCYRCGDTGHVRRNCPKKEGNSDSQHRKQPKVKRFWCALHKGDKSRRCYSNSCIELRKVDAQKRIELLKENGDCSHCCGDHKSVDCNNEERVCGGGRPDRGCSKSHEVHELFCKDAKVFLTHGEDTVVLCIMRVPAPKGIVASVFWDSGATSNFVKEEFAKLCGFKGHSETLSVTTLGGVVTDYLTVTAYNCSLKDQDGQMVPFKAYGLESITGSVTKIPSLKLQKLFPRLSRDMIKYLERGNSVDILMGFLHPSWHPCRAERATGGGDLWIYRGRFGACVGGSHPNINERTYRSNNLFTVNVNHTYFTQVSVGSLSSHELEYCPARTVAQYHSSQKHVCAEDCISGECAAGVLDVFQCAVSLADSDSVVGMPRHKGVPEKVYCERSVDGSVVPDPVVDVARLSEESVDLFIGSDSAVDTMTHRDGTVDTFTGSDLMVEATADGGDVVLSVCSVVCSEESNVGVMPEVSWDTGNGERLLNPDAAVWCPEEIWIPGPDQDMVIQPIPSVTCAAALTCPLTEDQFFQAESLGTVVEPACGGCKCSKCPVPGSLYSFKEQKEFDMIMKNLEYRQDLKRWFTAYPWKSYRSSLPCNDKAALKLLQSLEKTLQKKPDLAREYCQQIQDMVDRGVAIVLTEDVLKRWDGHYYYLPIVGVKGKKGVLRVCFDASRKQCGCEAMNDLLHKGPDRFMNDMLSVLLAFRNGRVGCVADIRKFHNQVHLIEEDVHMQRFLWRNMETGKDPQHYAVAVNNFGVKPANCIATCALRNSADQFAAVYPVESEEVKQQTYIDDCLTAASDEHAALLKTQRWDEICDHASMPNKGWTYSGDNCTDIALGGDGGIEKVLGLAWDPKSDSFLFRAKLQVKLHQGGMEEVEISSVEELERYCDSLLNRRMLLSNVQKIFDPVGLLAPILLQSKLLMRNSWCGPSPPGWDDLLPEMQAEAWMTFLTMLLSLGELRFPRSLWPEGEVIGLPILIVFSDGAALAFGTAAYIRWELKTGGYWTRLIMAKCKISPKNILSVPRMELNGAVMGNRVKNYILKNTSIEFSRVYQLVDSSTILGYVHKESGVFKPYEGIRVSEIQSTNNYVEDRLQGWAWVAGIDNPADWCTKPRQVKDLHPGGFWQSGPQFLLLPEKEWPIKLTYRTDHLEGEIIISKQCHVAVLNIANPDLLGRIANRCSSWRKMIRVLAWIMRLGHPAGPLTAEEVRRAKQLLIKHTQKEIEPELKLALSGKGRYRTLAPTLDEDGVWRVGSRVRQHVPFTLDSKLPVLLPTDHIITLQIMRNSHRHSHVAHDGTLCRFRMEGYWAVRAGVLAKKVASACVPCRKNAAKTLSQPLGEIPAEQLKQPVAWGHCQLDLFGPYHCRGDVNPRTTKKTWGMVVEDVNSGAVHLDVVTDYSTNAVLLTLRRFGSLRGWPGELRSDPGSQLESASGKLEDWWSSFGDSLQTFAGTKNFEWKVSPPDSPWRQGKVERRIGVVKRLLRFCIGDTRLSPLELQTVLMEISNICNERPIGLSKPRADGTYTVITPNQLLLGRSSNILPDDTELAEELPGPSRYRLVHYVTSTFWTKWCIEVSPRLIFRPKWHKKDRTLCIGDLVMICEFSQIKAKYKLGIVENIHISSDNCVRSVTVKYTNIASNGRSTFIRVKRSVQRLVLILPVEEQETKLEVVDKDFHVEVEECK